MESTGPEPAQPPRPALNLKSGGIFVEKCGIEICTTGRDAQFNGITKTAWVHILQFQPTDRPIEDRYSIDIQAHATSKSLDEGTTILLGVYDGHRGVSAAEYAAQALPSEVLSAISATPSTARDSAFIKEIFERFDRNMLSLFQESHPVRAGPPTPRHKRGFRSLLPTLLKKQTQRQDDRTNDVTINAANTTAALRVLSGCTATMLLVNIPEKSGATPSAKIINLGDSRTVVANLLPKPIIQATSTDINSSIATEQSLLTAEHPDDSPLDIFVGGRLFGDTLSTRAFGDALYKLPLRETIPNRESGDCITFSAMTADERNRHKYYIASLSAHQQTSRAQAGIAKVIPLLDRYDALFWAYKSPPYVSAVPEVVDVSLYDCLSPRDSPTRPGDGKTIAALLASDGLWDLVSSQEAVHILSEAVLAKDASSVPPPGNLAQILFNEVVERAGKQPGDDVTILVLVL